MCGVVGLWDLSSLLSSDRMKEACSAMTTSLVHRGPDSSGIWKSEQQNIVFGFRRLAIQDLSESGNQPMRSPDGNLVIVFNGEIYNHLSIRDELTRFGYPFKGHSDTETIVCAFQHWGIEKALSKFVGMFAIALWNESEETLYIMRDRLGIKPLFWTLQNGTFAFSSELKAMKKCPGLEFDIDNAALTSFLRYGYVPTPDCIFQNFYKLNPGTILSVRKDGSYEHKTFWSLEDVAARGSANLITDPEVAVERLNDILGTAVRDRMLSDVPLGAFLSGGIDSSTVVALMQKYSERPIKTFSIGFHEENYNEAEHAKVIASHLGTDHTELYVSAADAISVVPQMGEIFDEPFADSSQIPTFLVSKLAKNKVTVALSGDGGDELFGGYRRYDIMHSVWSKTKFFPPFVCKFFIRAIQNLPKKFLATEHGRNLYTYSTKLSDKASGVSCLKSYQAHLSQFTKPGSLLLFPSEKADIFSDTSLEDKFSNLQDLMQFIDAKQYLCDDILAKVDRASMTTSLELRVPILDHRLVEMAWRIPASVRYRDGKGKWPLRQVLYKHVPRDLVDRPKSGFSVPVKYWLKGELFEWGADLLAEERLQRQGLFDDQKVQELWTAHQAGGSNNFTVLWCLLMFQEWYESWNKND